MTLRETTRYLLDTLADLGVEPRDIHANTVSQTISLDTCGDFEAAAKAFKIKDVSDRTGSWGGVRHHEGLRDGLLIQHTCFPHLPCWSTT